MSPTYSAGEIFEIAQQIERNGERFYEKAAEMAEEPEAKALMRDLAEMERAHQQTFAAMSEELSEEERSEPFYDPNGEAGQYLRAVAGGEVFDLRSDPSEWLGDGRTMREILRKALDLEKDSISYYVGIRGAVPEALGKDKIEHIIREEMLHVAQLNEALQVLSGT